MLVTLIFYLVYLEGHITKKLTLKNQKKSMDTKLDTPSTLRQIQEFNTMIMDWLHWLEDDNILWNKTSFDLCSPITYVYP